MRENYILQEVKSSFGTNDLEMKTWRPWNSRNAVASANADWSTGTDQGTVRADRTYNTPIGKAG